MKFLDFFRKRKTSVAIPVEEKAILSNGIVLSPELSAYYEMIQKTALSFIRIKAVPTNNLSLTESKFAGKPYWPKDQNYPVDSDGKYMFLLAQINFSEMPVLEEYPQKGLLQCYISGNEICGLDFDEPTKQKDFRIVYFDDYNETIAEKDFSFLQNMEFENVPISKEMKLKFEKDIDYVGANDVRFEKNFGNSLIEFTKQFGKRDNEVGDELCDNFPGIGHKIGGYAYFTQTDPREYNEQFKDWILLLQIDSQDDEIMWGDAGVANFFIHQDDLKRKNFSNVMYNWDCC